ncbi:MAG: beta-propeller fold lactonase family protein [Gammaproteobacteria bacterium]
MPTSPTYTIGGTVSGIEAGQSVQLQNNGRDDLTVSANGAFTFATRVTSGGAYAVTVSSLAGRTCTVAGGSGTASTNVTRVAVVCVTNPPPSDGFTVGGTVSGLVGQGLTLTIFNHVSDPYSGRTIPVEVLEIRGNGDFIFSTHPTAGPLTLGLGVGKQPNSPKQRCVVTDRYQNFTITANVTVSVVCGEFLYVTNAADNTISAFSIDPGTGAIASAGPPVTAGSAPRAIAGSSDRKYLYIGNSGSNDVSAFSIDPKSGTLTMVPGSPFIAGTNPRAVSLFESTLVVANTGSNDLSAYLVDRDTGVPTPSSPASYPTGAGPSALLVLAAPHSGVLITGGLNDISEFYIGGGLQQAAGPYPSGGGGGVSSLAISNAGGLFLYAANATGAAATISGFSSYEPGGAAGLTPLPGFPYAVPSCSYIVADQTGAYLYATAGTNLLGYSIDAQTGALSPLPGFPVAVGATADSVSIDPTNQFLYVRNGSVGTITGFELNGATGALSPMPGSPFAVSKTADFIATF